MGNSNQRMQEEKYENVMKKFKMKGSIHHNQLGIVRVYDLKDDNNYSIFEFHKTVTTSEEAKLMLAHYKNRKCYNNDHLTQIFFISEQNSQILCQDQTQLTVIGEFFYNNIQNEMKLCYLNENIRNIVQQFPELRLWQITLQIVNACAFLEKNGRYHGEIKSKNIYLHPDQSVKLTEYNFIYGSMTGYQKALLVNDFQYLSPELLKELRAKNPQPNVDLVKSDVFALGLTLLELASLSSCEQYYDWISKEVHIDRIIKANDQLIQKGYSTLFTNLIYQMISEAESRPRFTDLKEVLSNFENDINNHIDFYSKYQMKQNHQFNAYNSVYTQPYQRPGQFNQTQSIYLPNGSY
ncbi:unnamed protein product (macronuclear) [Paramecium tetraurelia]|uniref:Protein kinase domain-containing protein n=1 Tax=Paramecium tetraurelia TaxID=5888 RepID=A0E6Z5_PARTE|nr:uncharacterized protein GSPATT00023790001 [Paramecium tetraurelia]CAK91062.1 unnamed protein product [Paramecium tetraurelia]|eukprot:XP_001458459.1 hypothetical protein (macronuclear) [Paramecium tetraurelia strain d4-2]